LLSTHILSEVEATCNRVLIINRGKLEASDSPYNLVNQLRTAGLVNLEVKTGSEDPTEYLLKIPGVKEVQLETNGVWRKGWIRIEANSDLREEIFGLAVERKWIIRELSKERATLEDVFVELTHTES
jgi:ABC-2 type transport system ATP-binding protein